MKSTVRLALLALPMLVTTPAFAVDSLSVNVDGVANNLPIPEKNALCKPTGDGKSVPGLNKRPTISWDHAPKGTQSFVVIVDDLDVPADFSKADKDGQTIDADAPRKENFYHWARYDIPGDVMRIAGGDVAVGVGLPADNDLKGYVKDQHDYGGPCPPWNDARVHHYHFTVYALDVKSLGLTTGISAKQLADKVKGNSHVLAQGEVVGTYTLNLQLTKSY